MNPKNDNYFTWFPRDLLRWWIIYHVHPLDYGNLLLTSKMFHLLTATQKSKKYWHAIICKKRPLNIRLRVQKRLPNTFNYQYLRYVECSNCRSLVLKSEYGIPEHEKETTLMFGTPEGNLQRENPKQKNMDFNTCHADCFYNGSTFFRLY